MICNPCICANYPFLWRFEYLGWPTAATAGSFGLRSCTWDFYRVSSLGKLRLSVTFLCPSYRFSGRQLLSVSRPFCSDPPVFSCPIYCLLFSVSVLCQKDCRVGQKVTRLVFWRREQCRRSFHAPRSAFYLRPYGYRLQTLWTNDASDVVHRVLLFTR